MPDTLGLVQRAAVGVRLSWGTARLVKQANLELSYAGTSIPAGRSLSLYSRARTRHGGAWADGRSSASRCRVDSEPGRYELFAEAGSIGGLAHVGLSLTAASLFAGAELRECEIAIGFNARASRCRDGEDNPRGPAGEGSPLGRAMGAGANLVRWNGRDRDGRSWRRDCTFDREALARSKADTGGREVGHRSPSAIASSVHECDREFRVAE